jgi:hypothetical protein
MQNPLLRILDNLGDDAALIVAPILEATVLDAFRDVFPSVRISTKRESFVKKLWQRFREAAGLCHE